MDNNSNNNIFSSNNDNDQNQLEMEVDRGISGGLSRNVVYVEEVFLDEQQQQEEESDQDEIEIFRNYLRSRVRPSYYNNENFRIDNTVEDIEFYGDDSSQEYEEDTTNNAVEEDEDEEDSANYEMDIVQNNEIQPETSEEVETVQ
ncbi:expressed protein, partial [Dictyostelium purpureum]